MSETQERYRTLRDIHDRLPIFSAPWYLDTVAGPDNWDVVMVDGKSGVDGVLPYAIRRTRFGTSLRMPKLTQTLGPWVNIPGDTKHYRRLSIEKAVMTGLIEQLPRYAVYRQNWAPEVTNWQPFYWHGFKQTTRYTYVLPVQPDEESAWTAIEQKTRKNIRRAEDTHRVTCFSSTATEVLWPLVEQTFNRQDMSVPYSQELFEKVQRAAFDHDQGVNIIATIDDSPVAGAFFVWDQRKMYYLASGSDRNNRETHALSLVLWEGIKLAVEKGLAFDFEGTMLETVEPHFRSFGALQTPYFQVWGYGSKLARLLSEGRAILRE